MSDELAALCDRVSKEHPEIRLLCPRGHFIIAVELAARLHAESDNSDPALTMWPAVGRQHHLGDRSVIEGNSGFVVENGPNGQTVTLSCDRCPRWTLTRNYQRLAVELAVYAVAGTGRRHRHYPCSTAQPERRRNPSGTTELSQRERNEMPTAPTQPSSKHASHRSRPGRLRNPLRHLEWSANTEKQANAR